MAKVKKSSPPSQASRGTLRKDKVKITAENEIAEGRLKIIGDLSQRQADRIVSAVIKEEGALLKGRERIGNLPGSSELQSLLKYYQDELQDIYYSSTQEKTSFVGENPIKTEYLPRLDEVIKNIKEDFEKTSGWVKKGKYDVPLLNLANKIKQILEKRISLTGKIAESGRKFLKSDVLGQLGQSALGGIEEKAPIVAMMMRSLGNRTKKNSYARDAEAARRTDTGKARHDQRYGEQEKPATSSASSKSGARPTLADTNIPEVEGGSATLAKDESGAGGQQGIIDILTHHTVLLEKISGTSSDMLKFFQDQAAKAAAAAEEGNLESQAGGAKGVTATKEKEEEGGGFDLMSLLPSFLGKIPGLGKFKAGMQLAKSGLALAKNLGKGAFNKIKNVAGRVTGGATASVAGDVAGAAAKTATKEVGGETAEAAGKKIAKEAAEAAAKQKAKKGLIKGIIAKLAPKKIAQMFGKSIPIVGAAIGGIFAVGKLLKGDYLGAGLEFAGGAAGPLTAIPATIVGLGRDVHHEAYGKFPGLDGESLENMKEITGQVTEAVQEQVNKLSGKGDKKVEGVTPTPPVPTETPSAPTQTPSAPTQTPSRSSEYPVTASKVEPIQSLNDEKKMIIAHEGIRYQPYKDSLGLWTVGVGHLIGNGKTLPPEMNRTFSHDEVMAMFDKDYEHHRKAAEGISGFNKFNATGQAALTDLTFNMGPAWSRKWPNTSKAIALGNAEGAASGLQNSKWYGQVGSRAPKIVAMMRAGSKNSPDSNIDVSAKTTSLGETDSQSGGAPPAGGGAPNTPSTSQLAGDMSAQGRVATTASLGNPGSVTSSGGSSTNIVHGGNTIVSSGGGDSASTFIPSPIDREPTLRHSGLA